MTYDYLVGLVRMTGRETPKLWGAKGKVLTPRRFGTSYLALVGAYLAVSDPLGVNMSWKLINHYIKSRACPWG